MTNLTQEVDGDRGINSVFDLALYKRLSSVAAGFLRLERRDDGWEAADLVHEAFIRIACSRRPIHFQSTAHVVALIVVVMRHILTDRSRSTAIFNRSQRVSFDPDLPARSASTLERMAVRNAVDRLREAHRRAYHVLEMHAIRGVRLEEVASRLSVSFRTVKRDWKMAQEWLGSELGKSSARNAKRRTLRVRNKKVATTSRSVLMPVPAERSVAEVA